MGAARPMAPDDVYALHQVTDAAWHPGGGWVAYVVGWPDEDTDDNRSVLRGWSPDGDRPLTHGHADGTPRFSPDGRWLAFLRRTAPGSAPQVAVLPVDGGDARLVTEEPDGVVDLEWRPDSTGLVIVRPVRPDDQVDVEPEVLARRIRRITSVDYRFNGRGYVHDRRTHLAVVDLPGGDEEPPPAPRALTDGGVDDRDPAVSPDGTLVAFVAGRRPGSDLDGTTQIWVVPIDGGATREWTAGPGTWQRPVWGGDGALWVLGQPEAGRIGFARLHRVPPGGGVPEPAGGGDVNRVNLMSATTPLVERDGGIYLFGAARGATSVDRVAVATGEVTTVFGGDRSVAAFDVGPDGGVAAVAGDAASLADLWVDGERVTDRAAAFAARVRTVAPEELTVPAADGYDVHAFLYLPPDGAGPFPGLVYVRGGPLAQWGHGFLDEVQLAVAAGYAVVAANPRGSDGYGEDHARAIVGDLGGPDWLDVQAVTEALAARPEVDAERIGIGGGSYGGFMTTWAVSHSDRYRAALVERAVTNWETMQGTSDIGPWFPQVYLGGDNRTDVDAVRRQSPMTYAGRIDTPTLIVHAEEDWRCPIEQAEQLFAALAVRRVETELVRVPGANHDLTRAGRPSHRVERFRIVHDWWARHLGGRVLTDRT